MRSTNILILLPIALVTGCGGVTPAGGPLTKSSVEKTLRDCGVAGTYSVKMSDDGSKPAINMGAMVLDKANDVAVAQNTSCIVGALQGQGYAPNQDFTFDVTSMSLPADISATVDDGQPLR